MRIGIRSAISGLVLRSSIISAVGVNINDTTELQAPFGGWKLSGIGRELGPEGLAAYRESKHIKLRVRAR